VIHAATLTDIYMVGRRGPVEASFTSAELAELGHLARVVPVVEGAGIPDLSNVADPAVAKVKDKNLEILRSFSSLARGGKPITLHLLFSATPIAFEGDGALQSVLLQESGGKRQWRLPVQTAITAIGYRSTPLAAAAFDEARGVFANRDGEISAGLYVVGWAKRGPSGVIATNRADSLTVMERLVASLKAQAPRNAVHDMSEKLRQRGVAVIDFATWLRIDKEELAAGAALGRPRVKRAFALNL